jgi:hypothetical protein
MHLRRKSLCANRRLQLRSRLGIDQHSVRGLELPALREQLRRIAMRSECDDLESIWVTRNHIERVVTDGACRSEYRHTDRCTH